ncbi:hypothetical protein [Burkholderia territorii]|uniref:hypothetical protein n=1 Tax=Burkholderia territorii TaxID=1503055 RepID=UPI000AD0BE8C|nr:hypothetical protein [Burkholderia territorii]
MVATTRTSGVDHGGDIDVRDAVAFDQVHGSVESGVIDLSADMVAPVPAGRRLRGFSALRCRMQRAWLAAAYGDVSSSPLAGHKYVFSDCLAP